MTIEFRCPQCNAQRTASEKIAGRRVRCPDCGRLVVVQRESESESRDWSWDDQHGETKFDLPSDEIRKRLEEEAAQEPEGTDTGQSEDDTPLPARPDASPTQPPVEPAPSPSDKPPSGTDTTVDLVAPVVPPYDESREKAQPAVAQPGTQETAPPATPHSFRRSSDDAQESEMDMTPMVDVTFLLLIFFMVTASFALHKAIVTQADPQDEPSNNATMDDFEDNADVIIVRIDQFNTYHIIYGDKEPIQAPSPHELLRQLRTAKQGVNIDGRRVVPKQLLVAAHGQATNDRVTKAMDAGTEIGMNQVQVVLDDNEEF